MFSVRRELSGLRGCDGDEIVQSDGVSIGVDVVQFLLLPAHLGEVAFLLTEVAGTAFSAARIAARMLSLTIATLLCLLHV